MQGFLLDTHVLLWWFTNDERLSTNAHEIIGDQSNDIYVSAASAWEIATKTRLGKLSDVPKAVEKYGELSTAQGFSHLSVTYRHGLLAGGFDAAHRDPFDRMLAAQSQLEDVPLVSRDQAFAEFYVDVVW
ncbi:type II toxin-antitoxin system VapC family toxin [Paramicrobacterium chengjingii]|uniref:type II toxin-antitoxin system VapC family toxin n=1 Tax=Paramicrobacterium chengjingii TaxID=2769067 RepID=UPI001420EEEE|nr:type II toxin-antitoxin system VapC family toxin [Microbacterium chengjingii]